MKIKRQTILLTAFGGIVCISLFATILFYFKNLSENITPKEVEFNIDNSKVRTKISAELNPMIQQSYSKQKRRSELFDDIDNVLARYDILDTYSIRLGFDGKLMISAHVQIPVMAIHMKNDDVYIIGSGMKIIDKNPINLSSQNIPHIFFSDIQVASKTDLKMNFAWFLEQIHLIHNNVQWYDYAVQKIIWTDSIGFTIKLLDPDQKDRDVENGSNLIVHLGHEELDTKIDRLRTIALVLREKNIKPKEIDLDLIEQAFIK